MAGLHGKTLIDWQDSFQLGVPAIDDEHRSLVELLNELYQALLESKSGETVGEFLGEIHAQIGLHFALEEKMMREHEYDEYTAHKDDHDRLLDELRGLMDNFDDGKWVDLDAFSTVLAEWFSVHFRSFDARLHKRLG